MATANKYNITGALRVHVWLPMVQSYCGLMVLNHNVWPKNEVVAPISVSVYTIITGEQNASV